MLTALGLCVLGWLSRPESPSFIGVLLALAGLLAFAGFVFWTLNRVPLGGWSAVLLLLASAAALVLHSLGSDGMNRSQQVITLANSVSSALLLGSMVGAMLLGHSYLIAPTMSIAPLQRLVLSVAGSTGIRAIVTGATMAVGLGRAMQSATQSAGQFWWTMLAARWLIGLVGPAVIAWMVWQTTRIRSTQSATGILYAGIIFVFFGELLGQLMGM